MQGHFKLLEPDSVLLATFVRQKSIKQLQEEILMQISAWIEEYTPSFCTDPWPPHSKEGGKSEKEELEALFCRRAKKLWGVWKSHLLDAKSAYQKLEKKLDLFDIAKQIEQGKGYVGQGRLGGNPFRDILLVDQIVQEDQAAITFFYDAYKPLAMKIKRDEDWWQDFNLEYVLQKNETTGLPAIASYSGKAGLSRWVNTTGVHFLIKLNRDGILTEGDCLKILLNLCIDEQKERYHRHFEIEKKNRSEPLPKPEQRLKWLLQVINDEQRIKYDQEIKRLTTTLEYQEYDTTSQCDVHPNSSSPQEEQWNNCLQMLGKIVLDLLDSFPGVDGLILKLRFLDGLTQDKIGAVVEKSKGQISKDLKRLEADLFEKLSNVIPKKIEEKEKCEACLELLKLPSFFTELAEWLKETYADTKQEGEEQ